MKILVADDDPVVRELLMMYLTQDGHDVTVVADGDAAVVEVLSDRPDLLVLDVVMPVNGLETTRIVKGVMPDLPIVLLTGRDTTDDIVASISSGADYYIKKPNVIASLRYFISSMTTP